MDVRPTGEAIEAKRGRFHNEHFKHEVDFDEGFELELHQSERDPDFELPKENDNEWKQEDDEDDVKVEIRNTKEFDRKCSVLPPIAQRTYKRSASNDDAGKKDSAEFRNRMKRPLDGHVANFEKETDAGVISRRTKQIEYGKNTPEYFNYLQAVPKDNRQPCHPRTPNKYRRYSRRAWDGIVKQWRINLHCWSDFPISASDQLAANESELDKFNESFTSEASGSTSTTSSVAAAFSAELGFLDCTAVKNETRSSRSASESESELSISGNECSNSTVLENKLSRKDQIKGEAELEKTLLSTSWADEVEEYYGFDNEK